jgi:hypothetical protein
MGFPVPTFNLQVNLWRSGALFANPPSLSFNANLSLGERVLGDPHGPLSPFLLCPKLTDIRGIQTQPPPYVVDLVECPAGSHRCYVVVGVEDVAKGFGNEYRLAVLVQFTAETIFTYGNPWVAPSWPYPTP